MSEREPGTEEATPRKLERMRDEGQIARSADVGAAACLCAGVLALAVAGPHGARALSTFTTRAFRLTDGHRPLEALAGASAVLLPLAAPLLAASIAALAAGIAQSRSFSFSHVAVKWQRLDVVSNLAQVLPGRQALLEVVKQLLKLGALGVLVYTQIRDALPTFATLSLAEPGVAATVAAEVAVRLFLHASVAFALVAAFDYWLAHRKFTADARMTRDEVKDERKQEEGSPELRGRLRRRMRELIQSRALSDVRKATVVVTNPTHYAVALRYRPDIDAAPLLLCKGKDELALRMREQARAAAVPVVENPPLARALFAGGKAGKPIPVELYRAAAEVIAYVFQLGRLPGMSAAPGARR